MLKNWMRSGDNKQKIEYLLGFWQSCRFRKIQSKDEKNTLQDNLGCSGNDILVSRAGQAKIANLDSCLNLVGSDFIVF